MHTIKKTHRGNKSLFSYVLVLRKINMFQNNLCIIRSLLTFV